MEQNKRISELLKNTIGQRYDAMALKMIRDEAEVPENAVYPLRDLGQHMALCQAFALSRREKKTVYMQKQDHWCWAPLIAYGQVELKKGTPAFNELLPVIGIQDPEAASAFIENFPHLPTGVYKGILTAPLGTAEFEPDVIVINCRNAELRTMLLGIKTQTGEDDVILSVPKERFDEFEKGIASLNYMGMPHSSFQTGMEYDFARPSFYNRMFKAWGLDEGKEFEIPFPTK